MDIPEPVLALIAAVFGGAGLKIVDSIFTRKQVKDETATDLRAELRDEVRYLREQLKEAEEENERIRNNYYTLREEFIGVKNDLEQALQKLTEQAVETRRILADRPPPPKVDG